MRVEQAGADGAGVASMGDSFGIYDLGFLIYDLGSHRGWVCVLMNTLSGVVANFNQKFGENDSGRGAAT